MSLRHQWSPPQWCTWTAPQPEQSGITTLRQNPLVSHLRATQNKGSLTYQAHPSILTESISLAVAAPPPPPGSYSMSLPSTTAVIEAPAVVPFRHPMSTYTSSSIYVRSAPRAETVNLPVVRAPAAPPQPAPAAEVAPLPDSLQRVPGLAFGPEMQGPKREILRNLNGELPYALLIRLDADLFVGFQCSGGDSHELLTDRCDAFIAHHTLNKVIKEGIVQKALTMMRKKDSLLKKRMLGQIKTASAATIQYSVIDILSLM